MHDIWNPWHGCHRVSEGCARFQVTFCFIETGSNFLKDGRAYRMPRQF